MLASPTYSPSYDCCKPLSASSGSETEAPSPRFANGKASDKKRSVTSDSDTEAPSVNVVLGEEFLSVSESETEEGTMAPAGIIGSDAAKDAHVDNTMAVPLWVSEPPSPLITEPPSLRNVDDEEDDEDTLVVGADPEK